MFFLDVIKLFILLLFAYFVTSAYKEYLPVGNQLADWTMKLMSNKEAIIISYFSLIIIFVLIKNPIKRLGLTIYHHKNKYKYDTWQGIILVVLILVLLFYLIIEYKYYLILPFLTFVLIEYLIKLK